MSPVISRQNSMLMEPSFLRVGARVPVTRAEGPGARYALWLQGCSIRCPGCCNPHLFDASSRHATAGGPVRWRK